MLRYSLLSVIFAASASHGYWINSEGKKQRVPCPSIPQIDKKIQDVIPIRIPAGCSLREPLIGLSREHFVSVMDRLIRAEKRAESYSREHNQTREQLTRCRAEQVENLQGCHDQMSTLFSTIKCPVCPPPPKCEVWGNRLTGALIGGSLCGGLLIKK